MSGTNCRNEDPQPMRHSRAGGNPAKQIVMLAQASIQSNYKKSFLLNLLFAFIATYFSLKKSKQKNLALIIWPYGYPAYSKSFTRRP